MSELSEEMIGVMNDVYVVAHDKKAYPFQIGFLKNGGSDGT